MAATVRFEEQIEIPLIIRSLGDFLASARRHNPEAIHPQQDTRRLP